MHLVPACTHFVLLMGAAAAGPASFQPRVSPLNGHKLRSTIPHCPSSKTLPHSCLSPLFGSLHVMFFFVKSAALHTLFFLSRMKAFGCRHNCETLIQNRRVSLLFSVIPRYLPRDGKTLSKRSPLVTWASRRSALSWTPAAIFPSPPNDRYP